MTIDSWFVQYCGGEYEIKYNPNRSYFQPKWFVKRKNDGKESKRYYSAPTGAFTAILTGSVVWEVA